METAGFTSTLYSGSNNPWGMMDASARTNHQNGTIISGTQTFGTYASLNDAALDIIDWMNACNFPKAVLSLADHVTAMANASTGSYFGSQSASDYLALVQQWVSK